MMFFFFFLVFNLKVGRGPPILNLPRASGMLRPALARMQASDSVCSEYFRVDKLRVVCQHQSCIVCMLLCSSGSLSLATWPPFSHPESQARKGVWLCADHVNH